MGRPSRGGSSISSHSTSSRSSSRSTSSRSSYSSSSRPSRSSYSSSSRPSRSSYSSSSRGSSGGHGYGGSYSSGGHDYRINTFFTYSPSDYEEDDWCEEDDWYEELDNDVKDEKPSDFDMSDTYEDSGYGKIFIAVFVVLALYLIAYFGAMFTSSKEGIANIPPSTTKRFKLSIAYKFDNDCIIDELGWFKYLSGTAGKLEEFYDLTGVQPYIALIKYSEEFSTEEARESYAREVLYKEMSWHEGSVLYVYFEGEDSSQMGYELIVTGAAADKVMNSEAKEIFWAYLNAYWEKDLTTDEVFTYTFNSTAERIMHITPDYTDVTNLLLKVFGFMAVIIILVAVYSYIRKKKMKAGC